MNHVNVGCVLRTKACLISVAKLHEENPEELVQIQQTRSGLCQLVTTNSLCKSSSLDDLPVFLLSVRQLDTKMKDWLVLPLASNLLNKSSCKSNIYSLVVIVTSETQRMFSSFSGLKLFLRRRQASSSVIMAYILLPLRRLELYSQGIMAIKQSDPLRYRFIANLSTDQFGVDKSNKICSGS